MKEDTLFESIAVHQPEGVTIDDAETLIKDRHSKPSPLSTPDDEPQRQRMIQRTMGSVARQVSLDTADDMGM